MENENLTPAETNQPQPAQPVQMAQPAAQPQVQKKKSGLKILLFLLVIAVLGGVGFYAYQNPQLFRAAVTESTVQPTVPSTTYLYIPEYDASAVDSGKISIKTKNSAPAENLVSMEFTLKYTPTDVLTFKQDSIVFDTGTLFKKADLKSIDTSTPGEVKVSFFSGTPAAVTADEQTLVKLALDIKGVAGSSVTMSVTDVSLIKEVAGAYSESTNYTSIAAGKFNLKSQNNLRLMQAESLDATHVALTFDDLLSAVGSPGNYSFTGGLTASAVESGFGNSTFSGYDQKTVILTTSAQTAGTAYTASVIGSNVIGNVNGSINTNYSSALFDGYKALDGTTNSNVVVNAVKVNSGTSVEISFSSLLKSSTVTPVNIVIKDGSGAALTVTKVSLVGGSVAELETAQQTADKLYFVSFDKVEDTNNLPLVNNTYRSFLGYTVPSMTVTSLNPKSVINDQDRPVIAVGSNLDTVDKIRVGSAEAAITQQSAGTLTFSVPKDFKEGVYDITLLNKANETKTLKDALTVNAPAIQMRVVSESSKAIPAKVSPDGKTEVTFWVLVEDPIGIANVDSVTIDLEQIGGSRAQEMTKDTGLQQKGKQFYTYKTTVSETTATQAEPYKLPVEVKKGAETAQGTVEITVTKDVLKSVPPTVDQVYSNPATIPPDGKTKIKISAKVSDQDGADTIKSVVADLGPIGAGFVTLKDLAVAGQANEQITGWFQSDEFTVPTTTTDGNYEITVTASDATGETATGKITLTVSQSITGPVIDTKNTYIAPAKSIPKDGKTVFSINAMVSDQDGVSDIDSVTAYMSTVGIKPVTLLKDPNASDSAKSALFSSADLTVPTTAPIGVHEIEVVAVDKSGGKGSLVLQLDVTYKDTLGDAPLVFSDKSYTNPKVAINDGKTSITLYAFVRDDDDDLDSVVANLSKIGQVGQATPPDFSQASAPASVPAATVSATGNCPTNSQTIVCMTPSFKEGRDGQWFVLSGVTVSENTPASSTPYAVEIIATDKRNKVTRGQISVLVSDSQTFVADKTAPQLMAAVPTAPGKLEVLFSEEMSALSLSPSGSDFTITEKSDISKTVNVLGAGINAEGTIVTLTTDSLSSGKEYVLTAGSKLTDASGIALAPKANRAYFSGFETSSKPPVVHFISATDTDTVEIGFQDDLRPSSVKVGESGKAVGDFDIKIFEADNPSVILPVKSVRFLEGGKGLEVKTAQQKNATKYRVQISDIASASGVQLKTPVSKVFKAIKVSSLKQAAVGNQADLNGDGKVDFIDFTMFSAVYGKVLSQSGDSQTSPAPASPSPIVPAPDSTVPHTSPTTATSPVGQ